MSQYAGLDLHSSNTYIGVLDPQFNRIFKKRVCNCESACNNDPPLSPIGIQH